MPGGSATLERPAPGARRQAAELASAAARAEGASTTATRRGRRADRSAIHPPPAGAWLAAWRRPPTRASSPAAGRQSPQEAERPASVVANSAKGLPWPQGAQRLAGLLDRRAGTARLVRHHEVPFFVAVEGFALVLAPAVLAAPAGAAH
jgi:hypothetical protein